MLKKFRFWSDKFVTEMSNLQFWLLSGVEHPPAILLEQEGCIKYHDLAPVVLSLPLKWKCRWSQEYAFLQVLTLHIWQHEAKRQDESEENQTVAQKFPNTGNISRWMTTFFHFSSTLVWNIQSWSSLGGCPDLAVTGIISFLQSWPAVLWIPILIHMDF